MKRSPSERQMVEALKNTQTDTVSISWISKKFSLGYNDAKEVFDEMYSLGLINSEGRIKIEQYPRDAEF